MREYTCPNCGKHMSSSFYKIKDICSVCGTTILLHHEASNGKDLLSYIDKNLERIFYIESEIKKYEEDTYLAEMQIPELFYSFARDLGLDEEEVLDLMFSSNDITKVLKDNACQLLEETKKEFEICKSNDKKSKTFKECYKKCSQNCRRIQNRTSSYGVDKYYSELSPFIKPLENRIISNNNAINELRLIRQSLENKDKGFKLYLYNISENQLETMPLDCILALPIEFLTENITMLADRIFWTKNIRDIPSVLIDAVPAKIFSKYELNYFSASDSQISHFPIPIILDNLSFYANRITPSLLKFLFKNYKEKLLLNLRNLSYQMQDKIQDKVYIKQRDDALKKIYLQGLQIDNATNIKIFPYSLKANITIYIKNEYFRDRVETAINELNSVYIFECFEMIQNKKRSVNHDLKKADYVVIKAVPIERAFSIKYGVKFADCVIVVLEVAL